MSDELKPCPFCGSECWFVKDESGAYVECMNGFCGSSSGKFVLRNQAIAAWNRRAGGGE